MLKRGLICRSCPYRTHLLFCNSHIRLLLDTLLLDTIAHSVHAKMAEVHVAVGATTTYGLSLPSLLIAQR